MKRCIVEAGGVVGGVPAKEIKKRFEPGVIQNLHQLRWWDWPFQKIKQHLTDIMSGNIEELIKHGSSVLFVGD
jgi:virginiamycin A acetyltransferase